MWKYSRCGLLLGCQSKSLINVNGGRTNACNFFSLGFDSSFLQSDLWRFFFGSEGGRESNRDIELKLWFIIKSNGLVMSLLWSYQLMHWPVRTPQGLSTALKYTCFVHWIFFSLLASLYSSRSSASIYHGLRKIHFTSTKRSKNYPCQSYRF